MPDLKTMREERQTAVKEIRRLADLTNNEKRDFTAEEREAWDKVNKTYDRLSDDIKREERAAEVEKTLQDPSSHNRDVGRDDYDSRDSQNKNRPDQDEEREAPKPEDWNQAVGAWVRHQMGVEPNKRQIEAARRCGLSPAKRDLVLSRSLHLPQGPAERRALSAVTGSAGGYTIPTGFVNRFEAALLAYGGVRQACEIMTTQEGNELPWPTTNDTANKGVRLAENTTVTEQDVTVGSISWFAYKYTSKLVKVPVELLEDSAFDIASELGRMLGERIGRILNEELTTGTGAAMPNGIVTASTVGPTTASATAITGDEILELIHSIDPAYRAGSAFMCHDNVVLAIRKLKDAVTGNYIWAGPGLQTGEPERLLGYALYKNQDMASSIAANAKTMLFGQLTKYKVRDVRTIRVRRLVERFADTDQEGFVAFSRHDGNLLDAGTHPVKHLLQHA